MKGKQYFDRDESQRGSIGHIHHRQKWCVEWIGRKYHVDSLLSGYSASSQEEGRPKMQVAVTLCDGSCAPDVEIPNNIWGEAFSQILALVEQKNSNSPLTGTEDQVATEITRSDPRGSVLVLDLMSDEGQTAGINLEFSDRQ